MSRKRAGDGLEEAGDELEEGRKRAGDGVM